MGSITVTGVGKAYKQYNSRFGRLLEWLSPFPVVNHRLNWVLKDLDFQIASGEAVGIIGINGAGKSTLLKMIAGTTHPTQGSINKIGKVAALLELGMGFHPDFTGRQNTYMAGQLLGLSSDEITRLLPEIQDFAEIGVYIDQPVRIYSSGMQVRLAFSIATALRPDILIVDEALSVGDAYFQHKSFERIREFRKKGTTLLLVSHDKQAIASVCDKAILLNAGSLEMIGSPEAVMDYYNALLASRQSQEVKQVLLENGKVQTISGTGEAAVTCITFLKKDNFTTDTLEVGELATLSIEVSIHKSIPRLILGYMIKDRLGQVVFGTNTDITNNPINNAMAGESYKFNFSFPVNIGPGTYSISTALVSTDTHLVNNYEWKDLALIFNVKNLGRLHFLGVAWIQPSIDIEKL